MSIFLCQLYNIFNNLKQGGFSSPQSEIFDLQHSPASPGSDDSQGDAGANFPLGPTCGPPTQAPASKYHLVAQKSCSRLTDLGDNVLRFFQEVEGKRQCKFCL